MQDRLPSPAKAGASKHDPTETEALLALSQLDAAQACASVGSSVNGLTDTEAAARLKRYGPNLLSREQQPSIGRVLWQHTRNPLNALLIVLAGVSYASGDSKSSVIVMVMVLLAITTSFVQEHRSNTAAAKLRSLVKTTASVRRSGAAPDKPFAELPIESLVPGDIVSLSAGDMIPGDLRLIDAKDLFVNQSVLTGESIPQERFAQAALPTGADPFELPNIGFMGANVVSGYGTGLIVRTGANTFFGALSEQVAGDRPTTAFDTGIARFTWMMIGFITVMAPAVFLINGLTKHDWLQAFMFAVAVAVGLTPELLPMIVTVNLAKGALAMSRAKVIVKHLGAIQNLGAMNILCTDKTGTLTQDRIILKRHIDLHGEESQRVLQYAWLNSHFQSGLKNLLDVAVLEHVEFHETHGIGAGYAKVDEVPFDFSRRRLSVVISTPDGAHVLICKGAVEEMFSVCTRYESDGQTSPLDASHFDAAQAQTRALNQDGFRVVALAFKDVPQTKDAYSVADESELTLLGFIAFLDPPKDSAREALSALADKGVTVKILTGDNEIVTARVCREVGLDTGEIVMGGRIDAMSDETLADLAEHRSVFAKLTPAHKARIVGVLRARKHVVGFMGDGINDSPALKAADVGISVDTAVDIAREAADVILLEKSLLVLQQGVIEGRRVFANITKYIRMGASSNFGNMFSVLGASLILPFLPMAPIQVLTNNLLYDFSQSSIPTDRVDDADIQAPRQWDISGIFRFMVLIGPISSIFDYATFAMMLFVFDAWDDPALFQTGWFVESLLTQTLIIHIIRTARLPFIESRASGALLTTTLVIAGIGVALPHTALGALLGFKPLPQAYWPLLAAMLVLYAVLTHLAKRYFVRRWGM